MKKKLVFALLTAMLVASLAGCTGGGSGSAGSAASGSTPSSAGSASTGSDRMDQETYMQEVDGLSTAAGEFVDTLQTAMSNVTSATDVDTALAEIETVRDAKQPFLDFAAITNPPEGFDEAHAKLAASCQEFGDYIDVYVDTLKGGLDGSLDAETYQQKANELSTQIDTIVNDLANNAMAVEDLAS